MKLSKRDKKLWLTLQFLIRLLILAIPLYIIIFFVNLAPLQTVVASQSGSMLSSLGMNVTQTDALIQANDFVFYINEDCTGWKSMIFFFALIFAVPKRGLKKRIFGLIGIPILWVINLFRVVSVVLIEQSYGVDTALLVHDYVWQFLLIIAVLILWLLWLKWSKK